MRPNNDREAITLIIEGLAKQGWTCYMVQNDTWDRDPANNVMCANIPEAVTACTAADEAFAYFHKGEQVHPEGPDAYIYFVLGNDPEEVACDYTTNLDPDLSNITDPWWNR